MNIVFATLGLSFSGDTLEKRALGGSETALLCVARELVKLGHDVRVYCNCDNEGIFDGVQYNKIDPWDVTWKYIDCDVFIVSRFFDLGRYKVNSKLNILWNHDTISSKDGLISCSWNYDYMYTLSEFHKQNYLKELPELEKIMKVISNGIDFNLVKREEKKHKIMFTSRPERGLIQALEIFENLNDKNLEFLICNYQTLDVQEVKQIEAYCDQKINQLIQKGFNIRKDRFKKENLYKEISESKAVIYPTQFPEIFCISAIEAQANGTVFLTTHDFALVETVGYCGIDYDEHYKENFLSSLKKIINDDEYRTGLEATGLEHVKKYSWANVAKQFETDFMETFKERSKDKMGIIKRLEYESDLVIAREIAKKYNFEDKVKQLDHDLRFVDNPKLMKEIYELEETHEKIELNDADLKHNTRFSWLADIIKNNDLKNVLDYACHMGLSSIITSNRNPDVKITGYDISERAIEKGIKRLETYADNKENITFTANESSLKKGEYDGLFCGEYLEHVLDPVAEAQRLESFVKPGGIVMFTVPRGAWEWISHEQNILNDVVYHVSHIDYQDVFDMFGKKEGFEVLSLSSGTGVCGEQLGQTLICYRADHKPIGKRDYERKELITRPYQGISTCIIAKDASKDIEVCLDSFYKDVDEVIIAYDPASVDRDEFMRRVEKYYNVIVYDMPKAISGPDYWGFANARNFTLNKAKHNWIFWIDTDERLIKTDQIKKYLDCPLMNGYVIKQHHAQLDNFQEADKPTRLFRKGLAEFVGYIHEQPQLIEDINAPIHPSLVMDCCNLVNFGAVTESVRREKALDRNLKLLEVDALENVEKRAKEGKPIRKLTMILIMRDFINRMNWGYERYKTFKTKDVFELCLPKIKSIYNKYFRNEKDELFKDLADKTIQKAYQLAEVGVPFKMTIGEKEYKTQIDIDDVDDVKEKISELIDNATRIQ